MFFLVVVTNLYSSFSYLDIETSFFLWLLQIYVHFTIFFNEIPVLLILQRVEMRVDPSQLKAEYFIMVEDRLQLIQSLRDDPDRPSTYNVS